MSSTSIRFSLLGSAALLGLTSLAQARTCPSAVDQSAVFAASQVVTVPHASSLNPGAEITVECWVRPDQAQQTSGLVSKWNDISASQRGYLLWLYNGIPWFYISPDGYSYPRVEAPAALSVGVWHHVAGTYAAGSLKLYVDGVLVASAPTGGTPTVFPCSAPVLIGKDTAGGSTPHYFKGAIDEVRIWNAAHSAQEIWAYRDVRVSEGLAGLIGSWNFDESSGLTAYDATASHNDGTLGKIPGNGANIPTRAPSSNVKLSPAHTGWTTKTDDALACQDVGTIATLRAAAGLVSSTVNWFKAGPGGSSVAVQDGPSGHGSVLSGAHTPNLTIGSLTTMDSASYYAVFDTDCGRIYSSPVTVNVCGTPACRADFDGDGFLTFEDFDAFVGAFEAGLPISDFNGDGFLDFTDFDAFIEAFELGC